MPSEIGVACEKADPRVGPLSFDTDDESRYFLGVSAVLGVGGIVVVDVADVDAVLLGAGAMLPLEAAPAAGVLLALDASGAFVASDDVGAAGAGVGAGAAVLDGAVVVLGVELVAAGFWSLHAPSASATAAAIRIVLVIVGVPCVGWSRCSLGTRRPHATCLAARGGPAAPNGKFYH